MVAAELAASAGAGAGGLPGRDLAIHLGDGGGPAWLHSAVLAAASPYFRSLAQVRGRRTHLCTHEHIKHHIT